MKYIYKNRYIFLLLSFLMVITILSFPMRADVMAATKTIEIYSREDLEAMADNLKGSYKLMADIDLSDDVWTPIGSDEEHPFKGSFNGNGHIIKGLKTSSEYNYQGLFGVTNKATIQNAKIASGKVKGNTYVGGVVGLAISTKLYNCLNQATVTGVDQVGGVAGRISEGIAINCQNSGKVIGTGRCAGGVTSDVYPSGKIYNCSNMGNVTGNELVGGITGGCTEGKIVNCNCYGNVKGNSRCGAISGDTASYAGVHDYNYFRKTSSVNANYVTVGEHSRTYNNKLKLDRSIRIAKKTNKTVKEAMNSWVSSKKKYGSVKYKKWNSYGSYVGIYSKIKA